MTCFRKLSFMSNIRQTTKERVEAVRTHCWKPGPESLNPTRFKQKTVSGQGGDALWGLEGAALPQVVTLAETGLWSMLSDPRMVGEATLNAIGAILIGVVVARRWLRSLQPALFGWLAGPGIVAGLACAGVPTAGLVLWLFIAAAVLLAILALVFN
jgi:hypothetical protein